MAWIAALAELGVKAYDKASTSYGAGAKAASNAEDAAKEAEKKRKAALAGQAAELAQDPHGGEYRAGLDAWAKSAAGRGPIGYEGPTTYGGVNVGPATHLSGMQDKLDAARQAAHANKLALAAEGKGPSVAGHQMQQNVEATLAANRAAASGMGRMNAGLAQRVLGQQQSAALGQAAMGSAQLKAQEAQWASSQLGDALSKMRAQDFMFAKQQADYEHATQLAQAGFSQQGQLASMDAKNRYAADKARFDLAQQGQNDALAQWYMGQKFAANQADRDAAIRAWSASQGVGLQQQGLDQSGSELAWKKYVQGRQMDSNEWAGRAGMWAWLASNYGSSGSGGGGGSGSKYDKLTE